MDNGGDDNRDMYGYYKCRGPCTLVFTTNATRKRYLEDFFNPLSASGDQHQISPCDINA